MNTITRTELHRELSKRGRQRGPGGERTGDRSQREQLHGTRAQRVFAGGRGRGQEEDRLERGVQMRPGQGEEEKEDGKTADASPEDWGPGQPTAALSKP